MTNNEIITTGIAVAAIIISWLSRQDSKKSAEASQKSADAAQRSNDLMARQLELATNEQNRIIQKEVTESRPRFDWRGGIDSPMSGLCEREFQNLGGEVTDLTIQAENSENGEITTTISPTNTLQHHGLGKIKFTGKPGKSIRPISFKINCLTKLGERWEKAYKMIWERESKIVEA